MTWPEAFCYVGCSWALAWVCYKIISVAIKAEKHYIDSSNEILKNMYKPMWSSSTEKKDK